MKVSGLLIRYTKDKLDFDDLRIGLTLILSGLKIPTNLTKIEQDRFNENIYLLSRNANFFFFVDYADKKTINSFSRKTQALLLRNFPEDLEKSPEIEIAIKLKQAVKLDIEFGKNLIPVINFRRKHFHGYSFDIIDGIAKTSLTAMQFSEAQKVMYQYSQNESEQLLSLICGILYQVPYKKENTIDFAKKFRSLPTTIKEAVLINFIAVNNYIGLRTKYSILFDRSEIKERRFVGLEGNLYMLSNWIYKNDTQFENIELFEFLDGVAKELTN
jgi:hypothetical protein